jgi:hypothetical protein
VTDFPTVRVAAVQATPVILDAEATVDKAVRLLGEAAAGGAQLAVLPETFVSIYPSNVWARRAAGFDGADCSHGHGECYELPNGEDYRGAVNVTASGHGCQRWSAQFPTQHFFTHVRYPSAGLGAHTSCRNPGGLHHRPWCFTTDSRVRWEECAVPGASEVGSCSERLHHHLVPPAMPRASSTCERHCPHAFALLLSGECDAAVECVAESDRDRASAPEALEWSDGLVASA